MEEKKNHGGGMCGSKRSSGSTHQHMTAWLETKGKWWLKEDYSVCVCRRMKLALE